MMFDKLCTGLAKQVQTPQLETQSPHLDIPVYATIPVHILQCFQHRVHDGGYHDLVQTLQEAKVCMQGTRQAVRVNCCTRQATACAQSGQALAVGA